MYTEIQRACGHTEAVPVPPSFDALKWLDACKATQCCECRAEDPRWAK
jgi:hypothetical protein